MEMVNECGGGIIEALNTKVYGNGTQTLVLSHGYGSDQSVWHFLIPYLACYFKVVLYDLVFSAKVSPKYYDFDKYSHFEAYAQDLVCILDELHVEKAIFLGHSMSAMIGCIASTRSPHLFQHLILLNGSPRFINTKGYYGGFERSNVDNLLMSMKQNFSKWVDDFAPKAMGVNDKASLSEFEHTLGNMKPEIAYSVAKTVFLTDNRWVLPRVHVPTTIIQSENDIIVPKSVAFYINQYIGEDSKVEILAGTKGHFPHLTSHLLLLDVLKKIMHLK